MQPPVADSAADKADAAVAVLPSTQETDAAWQEGFVGRRADAFQDGAESERQCRPCENNRADVTVCNLGEWDGSDGYCVLCADPRI